MYKWDYLNKGILANNGSSGNLAAVSRYESAGTLPIPTMEISAALPSFKSQLAAIRSGRSLRRDIPLVEVSFVRGSVTSTRKLVKSLFALSV